MLIMQETVVVLDSDYEGLAFDCTGCSSLEGSKTGWFASDDKQAVSFWCHMSVPQSLSTQISCTRQRNATSFFPKSHDCSNLTDSSI